MAGGVSLPVGVGLRELVSIDDHRGCIMELDRSSWHPEDGSAQWTLSRSLPRVLRGPHVHARHADRLIVLEGEMTVGLVDLRRDSTTAGMRCVFSLSPQRVLTIPSGVLHGFFFP